MNNNTVPEEVLALIEREKAIEAERERKAVEEYNARQAKEKADREQLAELAKMGILPEIDPDLRKYLVYEDHEDRAFTGRVDFVLAIPGVAPVLVRAVRDIFEEPFHLGVLPFWVPDWSVDEYSGEWGWQYSRYSQFGNISTALVRAIYAHKKAEQIREEQKRSEEQPATPEPQPAAAPVLPSLADQLANVIRAIVRDELAQQE